MEDTRKGYAPFVKNGIHKGKGLDLGAETLQTKLY